MKETKQFWRLFFAWQDEQEERWLSEMARKGWHMKHYNLVGYVMERGEPAEVAYRLDFQTVLGGRRQEYLGLFRDAGWEHVQEFANWHYFRAPVKDGVAPEIFTDVASKVAKYRRLITILLVVMMPNLFWILRLTETASRPVSDRDFFLAVTLTQAAVSLLLGVCIFAILMRIRRLRRQEGRA